MKLRNEIYRRIEFNGRDGVTVHSTGNWAKDVPGKHNFTIVADPFDELKKAQNKLKPFLLEVCGLNTISLVNRHQRLTQKMNEAEIKVFEKEAAKTQCGRMEISAVQLSYDADGSLTGCRLLAEYFNSKQEPFTIKTPLVHLQHVENGYGIETELQTSLLDLIDKIEDFQNGKWAVFEDLPEEEEVEEEKKPKAEKKQRVAAQEEEEEIEPEFGAGDGKGSKMAIVGKGGKALKAGGKATATKKKQAA